MICGLDVVSGPYVVCPFALLFQYLSFMIAARLTRFMAAGGGASVEVSSGALEGVVFDAVELGASCVVEPASVVCASVALAVAAGVEPVCVCGASRSVLPVSTAAVLVTTANMTGQAEDTLSGTRPESCGSANHTARYKCVSPCDWLNCGTLTRSPLSVSSAFYTCFVKRVARKTSWSLHFEILSQSGKECCLVAASVAALVASSPSSERRTPPGSVLILVGTSAKVALLAPANGPMGFSFLVHGSARMLEFPLNELGSFVPLLSVRVAVWTLAQTTQRHSLHVVALLWVLLQALLFLPWDGQATL